MERGQEKKEDASIFVNSQVLLSEPNLGGGGGGLMALGLLPATSVTLPSSRFSPPGRHSQASEHVSSEAVRENALCSPGRRGLHPGGGRVLLQDSLQVTAPTGGKRGESWELWGWL